MSRDNTYPAWERNAISPDWMKDYNSTTGATGGLGSSENSFWDNLSGKPGRLGGAIGGMLGDLFGGQSGQDPMEYLSKIIGQASPYLKPYSEAGKSELGPLSKIYGEMGQDPGELLNKIGEGYHKSPGFDFAMQQAMQGAGHSAASGGMAGSPLAQQQAQRTATGLANQDYYNWLNKAMGTMGQGLQGMQGLAGLGMEGGMGLSNLISQALATQAQEAYADRANEQQSGSGIGGILGAIAGSL